MRQITTRSSSPIRRVCWVLLILASLMPGFPVQASGELIVAAAASLHATFKEAGEAFHKETGIPVTLVFGASGSLAHQVENGAPYDLLASADLRWLRRLAGRGHLLADSLIQYAEGGLVLAVGKSVGLAGLPEVLDATALEKILGPGRAVIALAHPERAPYGFAAREALQGAGLWERLHNRLVFGDNVRQTLTYLETGNADAALVAEALLVGAPLAGTLGNLAWKRVHHGLYAPILQGVGIVSRSERQDEARRFVAFLTAPTGRALLIRHGFRLPPTTQGPTK